MRETCQDLALHAELPAKQVCYKRHVDKLDGDLLLKLVINAASKINGAHSTTSEEPVKFVRSDKSAPGSASRIRISSVISLARASRAEDASNRERSSALNYSISPGEAGCVEQLVTLEIEWTFTTS